MANNIIKSKIGKLADGETINRDALHVPVARLRVADDTVLVPGQPIKITSYGEADAINNEYEDLDIDFHWFCLRWL